MKKHRNARLSKAERRRKFTNKKNKKRMGYGTYLTGKDALIATPVKYDWKFNTIHAAADYFPPENKVEFPEPITALTTDSKGLNVFTKDAVYRSQPSAAQEADPRILRHDELKIQVGVLEAYVKELEQLVINLAGRL